MSLPSRPARAGCGASKVEAANASTAARLTMAVAGEGLAAARMDDFMSFSLQNMELRGHYADRAGRFTQPFAQRGAFCPHGRHVIRVGDTVEIDLHVRQSPSRTGSGHQPRH